MLVDQMADFDISQTLHWIPASKTQHTIAPLSSKQTSTSSCTPQRGEFRE
ncbi:conserved hypothetical protein [Xylella fastidiosa M12]|nr:conserved hypothetical protein [Xylella fastidiosa M12]